jgi:hypothetical protein
MTEKTKFNDPKLMEAYLEQVLDGDLSEAPYKPENIDGVDLETVKQWGGEGEGDSIGYILKVTEADKSVFVEVTGYYDSYNGSDFSSASVILVEPKEVTVTKYFPIKL